MWRAPPPSTAAAALDEVLIDALPCRPKRPRQDDPPAKWAQDTPRPGITANCKTNTCMLTAMLQHRLHITLHSHTHHTTSEGSSAAPPGKASSLQA
eukprot:scaffold21745_cov32-Tisochrysis_lutea.AAC.3